MSAGSALDPLQAAIHTRLTGNAGILASSAGSRIFDEVPENTEHDFLVHGDAKEEQDDTMGRGIRVVEFAVEAWSDYRGSKAVKQIADLVIKALDGLRGDVDSITVTGFELIKITYVRTIIQRQGDLVSRWGAMWFRAWLREA